MADMDGLESSVAWAALGTAARKTSRAVQAEIAASGTDHVAITYDTLSFDYSVGAPAPAIRLLRSLQMVTIEPGQSLANVFRLSSGYRDLDEKVAASCRGHGPVRPARQVTAGR